MTNARPSLARQMSEFAEWIGAPDYPCLGAKSARARNQLGFIAAGDISSGHRDEHIHQGLLDTVHAYRDDSTLFRSSVVLFDATRRYSEADFEQALWARLQSLTDIDQRRGYRHDPRVRSDPDDRFFSLSFGGEAFYAIGLHPDASRLARRFSTPAIVFNIHDQFVRLRADGLFDGLSTTIHARDIALCGSKNPMLGQHGQTSEARQYSGRITPAVWTCPFHRSDPEKSA